MEELVILVVYDCIGGECCEDDGCCYGVCGD